MMRSFRPYLFMLLCLFQASFTFRVYIKTITPLERLHSRLYFSGFNNEEALTQLLNSYDFRGAYDFVKKDPMLKISKENAIKLLNNLQKLEPEPPSSSQADQSKKGTESCSLIYRRLEKQKLVRGFNCLSDAYPESASEISPTKLEAITGLPLNALTPRTRTTYWRLAGVLICLLELVLGFYFGIDPVFTLIPITIFAFAFDQIALKGAIFETLYRAIFPEYKKKVITHEAGHLLIAYLLGLPIRGVVTNAWEARKYPEIQGSAGTIFFDEKFSGELENQKVTRSSLDRLSVAFMAGIAAEAIEFGVCEGGAADEKSLISLFTSISPAWNIIRIQGQARWAVAQCILLLREHRDSFKAVVKALEQEKELGEIIFDIEANLPYELPATRRVEEKLALRKEKDKELLFRMIQKKTWKVGGIQPIQVQHTDQETGTKLMEASESQVASSEANQESEKIEDSVDLFAKRIEMLQKAVQRGDLDVNSKSSGGVWLNGLSSLRKPSVEDTIRQLFQSDEDNRKRGNSSIFSEDMTIYQLLETHRGFLMKEVELQEKEAAEKLSVIETKLSNIIWILAVKLQNNMGCLCSKASAKDLDHSHARETEISNVLHQSISLKNSTNKLASLAELFITNQFESFSLFHCPASEELLKRCWIYKRGHLVRTWKKRYCVLDKNDINYYVKSSADPPYGKKLKGKVALLGAVCIDRESNDGKNIEVEIYGNVGEKDLFFSVENTEEGQSFVRILQWSIRKSTLTMLARNIKSVSSSGKKDKSNQLKYTCTQWKENQNLLFQASIEKLLSPQLYYMLLTEPTGQIVMKPCILKLWNIFGEDYIPNIHTEASHMGIGWHVIYPNDIEQYNGKGLPFFTNLMRFISFDDIIDMTFQYVDDTANEWLKKNINYLHHHGNFSTSDNNTSTNNSSKKQKKENEHPLNEDNIYMIITLLSKYDYKIQILACCLHDYNDCLLAIQNILLFIQARTKLIQANTSSQMNEGQSSSRKSSANSMSIHQSSAAKAASLVLD